MNIKCGAYVEIPESHVYESLAESCFVLLGADSYSDMFSLSDERINIKWYGGHEIPKVYRFVQWSPDDGAVQFYYNEPKEDSRSYEVTLRDLIKAVENVLQP